MKISLTPEQARDLPYPLGCPVWYNFPTSAQSFDASNTEPPILKRGIIDSVTLDMFTRNMVYKVVYKDDTQNISIIDEVGEKELAYGASCPVYIVADSDAAAEEVDEEEKKEDEEGATPKNSQEGTVLYAEPSPNEPGKVVYTIMIHGEEESTQSRYVTGIKAERVKYRKVVNENVIETSTNKEDGIIGNDKLEIADRISPLTLQTEEEEVPVTSITLKSSPEEGQIDDSNNTKRSSVSTLGDGGSSTIHRQSMGGSTRGSGGNDTDVGSYMRGSYGSKGHDYTRDTSRDSRPIDEAAVDKLLSDRLYYKKKHMYDKADELHDELLKVHGVTVRDGHRRDGKSKTYTTERAGRPESMSISVPMWLQNIAGPQDLFAYLLGKSQTRQNPSHNVNLIGKEYHCRINVNRDSPITITIRSALGYASDIEASRLMIIDLLLEYVGNDGSRGRLVYDVGISCPGPHNHEHSSGRAIQAGDPFGENAHIQFITVLPLPYNSLNVLYANFQRRLWDEVGVYIKVVGDYFHVPCKLCDPYLAVMGSSVEGIDKAVRMIKEVDK